MKMSLLLSFFLTIWLVGYEANAQDIPAKSFDRKRGAIDSLVSVQMREQHITGLSLGIIVNGQLVMARGYGLSNIEHNVSASERSVYKIGSISKQMIATAIMWFVQEGRLKLTDSLPLFFKGAPASWNKITIRHLLNHTSGLPRESPIADNMKVQPDSILIEAAYKSPMLFETGTNWRYCNLGYFMLADIIRKLSGQPFAKYMENEVFKKYNMLQTRTTTVSDIVKDRAAGYVYKNKDSIFNAKDYLALRPSGAFLSSVNDLIKWEMLIQHNQLLNRGHWRAMWTDTVRTSIAKDAPAEYYGYGWDVKEFKKLKIVHHGGTLPGFASSYFRFLDSNSAIIILTNADNSFPSKIALGIADMILPSISVPLR
jgi:CubicO group peptidase (beta-lactamase class C family)